MAYSPEVDHREDRACSIALAETAGFPHGFGETRYGLRVERGFREFSALWSGPPEEDKQLSDLFETVVAIYRRSCPDE